MRCSWAGCDRRSRWNGCCDMHARRRALWLRSQNPGRQPEQQGNPELAARLKTMTFDEIAAYCDRVRAS